MIIGFLIADRLHLDAEGTAGAVGVALFTAGLMLVGAQGAAVPKLGWPALRLIRVGTPIAAAAYAMLTVADQLWSITAAFAVLSIGLGLAIPGFTAAPTLVVGPDQPGSIAGLVNATTGATFIVGPLLGTALYELTPVAPIVASLAAALLALGLSWTTSAPSANRLPELT